MSDTYIPRINIPMESQIGTKDLKYLSDIYERYGFVKCLERCYELGYYRKSKEDYKVARKA